jgi:hypothetical protein
MARTIQSPGVQINEVDISQISTLPAGTNVFITGYSAQGPTDQIVNVTSITEFQQIYGAPTTAAERYFYYSAQQVLNTNANVSVCRLPYDSGLTSYSALAFPVFPLSAASLSSAPVTCAYIAGTEFYIGAPTYISVTDQQYDLLSQGIISWGTTPGAITALSSIGNAGIVILNNTKVTIDEKFQGYYISFADNSNLDPTTSFNDVTNAYAWNNTGDFLTVPQSRLDFSLSSVNRNTQGYVPDSTSEIIENIPTFDISSTQFEETIIVSVFKLAASNFSQDILQLQQQLSEGYVGSFNAQRQIQNQNGGPAKSFYLENVIDGTSPNISIFINPNISRNAQWTDVNGNPVKRVRVYRSLSNYDQAPSENYSLRYATLSTISYMNFGDNLYTFSVYAPQLSYGTGSKNIGNIPLKLAAALNLAANPDIVPIDVTIDAGLSTVWSVYNNLIVTNPTLSADGNYDETLFFNLSADPVNNLYRTDGNPDIGQPADDWYTIFNTFDTFARLTRKDHLFVSDPLRQILVEGADLKTEDAKYVYGQIENFSQHIYWPLKNLYGFANSSYSAAYANWVKVYDAFSDKDVWVPFSGFAAALYANTDTNFQPWFAPAGLTRGVVQGILDIAVNPQQKERDLIAKIPLNALYFSPSDGFVTLSECNLQKQPSALNRIHIRRLFLVLEKATLQIAKFFVQEPNTTFTRSRLVNALNPIFKLALDTQGLYDYLIVCDTRNNTPTTIDNNELHVNIYLKPVRSAEFILVNFFATRTDQNFNELI